jgi:phosphoglycolate phosphatase-like HAD superfamily hydrolase
LNKKSYIFFDLDGPILDVSDKYYRVYADLVFEQEGQPIPKPQYWNYKRQQVPESTILRFSGLEDSPDYHHLRRMRLETIKYLRFDRVWPGIPQLLDELGMHHMLVLVTLRQSPDSLHWELDHLGLQHYFRYVLSRETDGTTQERAEVKVSLVREALGSSSLTGWFVGDTETDVCAGQILSVRTVAVSFGIRTAERLTSFGPEVLLHSPEELGQWAQQIKFLRHDTKSKR